MKRINMAAFVIILFLFSEGCGVRLKTSPDHIPTVSAIIAELKSRYDLIQTLKTWMNVTVRSEGQKYEVRELLYYKHPDKLRVQAMGPLNEPRAIVLTSDGQIVIFFVQEKEARVGALSDKTLEKIFDIDVRISDIKSAIFANPFLDDQPDKVNLVKFNLESEGYLLTRPHSEENHTEEVLISPKQIVVKQWKLTDAEGNIVQKTVFSDYREIGGIIRPLKVTIERFDKPIHLSFESVKPQVNLELSDTLFAMPFPEGTVVLPISN